MTNPFKQLDVDALRSKENVIIAMLHHVHTRENRDKLVMPYVRQNKRPKGTVCDAIEVTIFPPRFVAEFVQLGGNSELLSDPDLELETAIHADDFDRVRQVLQKYPSYHFPYVDTRIISYTYPTEQMLQLVMILLRQGKSWHDRLFVSLMEHGHARVASAMIAFMQKEYNVDMYQIKYIQIYMATATDNVAKLREIAASCTWPDAESLALVAVEHDAVQTLEYIGTNVCQYGVTNSAPHTLEYIGTNDGALQYKVLHHAMERRNMNMILAVCRYASREAVRDVLGLGYNIADCGFSLWTAQVAAIVVPHLVPGTLSDLWFYKYEHVTYALSRKWNVPSKCLIEYQQLVTVVEQYVVVPLSVLVVEHLE
jgi:hypothetical protein